MLSIGIDVSKGKSTVCGMKPGGEIVYTPFEVQHTREGMSELVSLLRSSGEEVRVVLESTGSYHCPVVAALLENGIFVSVVNSLRRYHHTTHILEMGETRFRKDYCKWAEKKGYRNCERMAVLIFATAQNGIPVLPNAPSTQIVITEAIRVLHTVEASRDAILTQMQALAKTLPEYSLVREMPCIGDTLAPRLIAEIGDVRRFHSKRALIAYAGIDAPPYQSGKFCANNRHISKRGNRYLRKTGYEVMQSYVMHKPANDPIFTFIEKKRSEGKSGKLAMVAGLNKFLRVYYGKVTELYRSLPAIE